MGIHIELLWLIIPLTVIASFFFLFCDDRYNIYPVHKVITDKKEEVVDLRKNIEDYI